jgi:4-aminobutyrate aminotransferase
MLQDRGKNLFSPVLGKYHELEISAGKGCYLIDKQGKKYLDFGSGIAVASTGHCHRLVVAAIQKQAAELIHPCIAIGFCNALIECAEAILKLFPHDEYQLFFDQSGAAAVEAALKLAKYVTKKHKVIAFTGGFHGRSMGALSVTTSKKSYQDNIGPMLEGVEFFPYPYCYRCPWGKNKESCESLCVKALKESSLFTDDVAAVIIEPVLGEGGYIPAPKKFLKHLETICKEKNILLILDEIQTGIGRTGTWFNFEKSKISPDIVVSAKGLGSGMPISACIAKKEIMDQWVPGSHGGTYGGNPVACAATLATLDIISESLPSVNSLSTFCKQFLDTKLLNHRYVGDIRIEGLMIGIEFVKDKNTKTPFPEIINSLLKAALKKQLILISCGIHSNVIRLAPPLTISADDLKKGLKILCEVIYDYN